MVTSTIKSVVWKEGWRLGVRRKPGLHAFKLKIFAWKLEVGVGREGRWRTKMGLLGEQCESDGLMAFVAGLRDFSFPIKQSLIKCQIRWYRTEDFQKIERVKYRGPEGWWGWVCRRMAWRDDEKTVKWTDHRECLAKTYTGPSIQTRSIISIICHVHTIVQSLKVVQQVYFY